MKNTQRKIGLNITLSGVLALSIATASHAVVYDTRYSYDTPNGVVTKTDPNGNQLQYRYNRVNRLTEIKLLNAPGQPAYGYEYDATNQLSRITYPGGEQKFDYDDFDRLAFITDFSQPAPLLAFAYDHRDRITWITYPGNGAVCYEYDPDGRITRVGRVLSGAGTVCSAADEKTDYTYDSKGRLSGVSYPNGIQRYLTYDNNTGQVKETGYRKSNGTLIYSDTFAYLPGTILYQSITRATATTISTTRYEYDAYQRLTRITEADGRRTDYQYDPFGNRTRETITNITDPQASGGSPKAYGTYDYIYATNSNRLNRINFNGALQETLQYDNAGRITSRTKSGVTTNYTFDDRGLLTQVTKPGMAITYTYDALGVRKTKTVNGQTTRYLTANIFGLPHVLAELDTSMNIKATYVYAGNAQLKEEPVAADRSKDLYLLHDGINGSITHATDMTGRIRNQYDYDAFGARSEPNPATSSSYKNYGYTGEEYDEETGLLYLRARYYDPTLGRFISADPYWGRLEEPVTQNRYIYVQNNPLLFTDPSGLDTFDFVEGVNSVGIGFGRYLGYSADLIGLNGEQRQVEVERYLYTFEKILGEINQNKRSAVNFAADLFDYAYEQNPDYIRGRSLVGPSVAVLTNFNGGSPVGLLLGAGITGGALLGDVLYAIESGSDSLEEIIQFSIFGDLPIGGSCAADY